MYDHVLIPNKMNEVLCQMIRRNALNETKGMQRYSVTSINTLIHMKVPNQC